MTFDLKTYATGGAQRPDSFSGMQPDFSAALANMFQNAPENIRSGLQVSSGFRSPDRQAQLWDAALQKYGSAEAARKWVAPPGKSQHNHGNAADLKFLNPAAQAWVHQNAGQYGLAFPLANEAWHVELAGARGHGHQAAAAPGQPGPLPVMPSAGPTSTGIPVSAPPQAFGDMIAPPVAPAPPNLGQIAANYLQRRKVQAETEAADQARRQALFGGGLGDLYG